MESLILRLDAPLMSFGGVIVDHHGFTDRFPGQAMLTGLLANCMGWSHQDIDRLEQLQSALSFSARWDVVPESLIDYHTVDLGQDKMKWPGWTTRGTPEHRGKGAATTGIHQRYRHYWADGLMTVALSVTAGDSVPPLEDWANSLNRPKRPPFIGRKTCLPARPLLDPVNPVRSGRSLRDILRVVPAWGRDGGLVRTNSWLDACWPGDEPGEGGSNEIRRVYDLRDWRNQLSSGSRLRCEGRILVEGVAP